MQVCELGIVPFSVLHLAKRVEWRRFDAFKNVRRMEENFYDLSGKKKNVDKEKKKEKKRNSTTKQTTQI